MPNPPIKRDWLKPAPYVKRWAYKSTFEQSPSFLMSVMADIRGITMKRIAVLLIAALIVSGCATVRQVDLDAWVGQPVVALETHPIFLTVPVVKTKASDGTEIWNYVNGANLGQCSGGGSIYNGTVDYTTYSKFSSCVQRLAACNNIFFIRDGRVVKYTPIGTGGAHCYTTEQLQPGFSGATNIR